MSSKGISSEWKKLQKFKSGLPEGYRDTISRIIKMDATKKCIEA